MVTVNETAEVINRLPPEVTQKIFSYLPNADLINCTFYVCQRWKGIANCRKLWRKRTFSTSDMSLVPELSNLLWDMELLSFFCVKKCTRFRTKYSCGNLVVYMGPVDSSADLSLKELEACPFMKSVKSVKMEDDILVMILGEPENVPPPCPNKTASPKCILNDSASNVKPAEHKDCLFEGSVRGSKVGDVVVVTRMGPPEQSVYNPGPAPPRPPAVPSGVSRETPAHCGFGDAALSTLCGACPALESVDLWGLRLSDGGLRLLGLCRRLAAFRLAKCSGVASLDALRRCRRLSHVIVDACPDLQPAALRVLAELPALEALELYEADLQGFPFQQVAGLPLLASFTVVNCRGFSQKDLSLMDRDDLELTIEFKQDSNGE